MNVVLHTKPDVPKYHIFNLPTDNVLYYSYSHWIFYRLNPAVCEVSFNH